MSNGQSPDPTAVSLQCRCEERGSWFRVEDDEVLRWPVLEIAEWEELRECPVCARIWVQTWPEELESLPILCRPVPEASRRLKEIHRAPTMRPYCLARLGEHLGELKEQRLLCKKVDCERRRLQGSGYCLEHLIADRFGRNFAALGRETPIEEIDDGDPI